MKRELRVHYEFAIGGCGKRDKPAARQSPLTADTTCRRCIYRLWVYGNLSDYDPRITRAMRLHRVEQWRERGWL